MKKVILLVLLASSVSFLNTSCNDRLEEIIKKEIKEKKEEEKKFDCPELEKNYKDACETASGKRGFVNEDCECEAIIKKEIKKKKEEEKKEEEKKFDCPELEKNYKDACETASGKRGFVNEDCKCQEKNKR